MVLDESLFGERLRRVLEPFATSFTGSLGRGDLVIPESEIDRLVKEMLQAARDASQEDDEVSEHELVEALLETRRLGSVQEQAGRLRSRFQIRARAR